MERILHTIAGTFLSGVLYIITLLVTVITPYKDMLICIVILALIDFGLAVLNAIFRHVLESRKLTKLVIKLGIYLILFLIVGITKGVYNIDFLEWAFIPVIVMREVCSILGNIAILYPKFGTIKILKLMLEKEIEIKTENIQNRKTDGDSTKENVE